jgi:hypothetical protein
VVAVVLIQELQVEQVVQVAVTLAIQVAEQVQVQLDKVTRVVVALEAVAQAEAVDGVLLVLVVRERLVAQEVLEILVRIQEVQ